MKKFLRCGHCGNLVGMIHDAGVPISCCGENNVPVVEINGDILTAEVGSVEHPMLDEHYIQWIFVETEDGGQKVNLNPGEKPTATFNLNGKKPVAVYEYCNLHGLWKTDC